MSFSCCNSKKYFTSTNEDKIPKISEPLEINLNFSDYEENKNKNDIKYYYPDLNTQKYMETIALSKFQSNNPYSNETTHPIKNTSYMQELILLEQLQKNVF